MKTTIKKILASALSVCMLGVFVGCDSFLGELKPLDKVSGEDLTTSEGGIKALLANVYTRIPMEDFAYRPLNGFNKRNYDGVRGTCNLAFFTDEAYRSEGDDSAGPETFSYWNDAYKDIRQVNLFIASVKQSLESKNISAADAAIYSGEGYFARAYIYFALAKRYGGVPLIDHAQDKDYVPGDENSIKVARSTEKETWKFIIEDCDRAAEMLPETFSASSMYRATRWAALALKSRIALFAASVAKYSSRAPMTGDAVSQKLVGMAASDAEEFYQACLDASFEIIKNSGKSLYMPNPASAEDAAKNFQQIFLKDPSEEIIFSRGYLDGTIYNAQGHSYSQNYILSQVNTGGALRYGRFSPSLDLVDLYEDYSDDGQGRSSKIVTRTDSKETPIEQVSESGHIDVNAPFAHYADAMDAFKGKDARLLASVIVPGSNFGSTKIIMQGGIIAQNGTYSIYANDPYPGKDGKTYYGLGGQTASTASGFFNLGGSEDGNYPTSGFSVRKYMEEFSTIKGDANSSTTAYIDFRLPEIYLNYAEAVVESGRGDASLAKKVLNDIRHRAAHTDDIDLTLDNVLKERRVELAFEGKRYWDLIRRREMHTLFSQYRRTILIPMLDLRQSTPDYVFVRAYAHGDERKNGLTFQIQSYYASIPGIATSGLVQNPGY